MKPAEARVLLTGAAGGIGRAAAEHLVRSGASVTLVGRSAARLAAQARELAALAHADPSDSSRIAWHVADLTDPLALQHLAAHAVLWRCNVVVHGAGVPAFGPFVELPQGQLQSLIETNLVAPMQLTQALLPHLQTLPRAQVMFVGSALGRLGLPGFAAYTATKFGLRGFAEALRRELGDTPVRVQYLGPRSTHTGFNDTRVEAYLQATGAALDPPERVAQALLRLLESGRAERYIGYPESIAVRLNGIASSWLDGVFRKHRRSLQPRT